MAENIQYYLSEEWRATDIGPFASDGARGQFVVEKDSNEVLVVWTETSNETVYARTMDSDGMEVLPTVQVDDGTIGLDDEEIGACVLQNGNVVLTWESNSSEPGFVILDGTDLSTVKSYTDMGAATWEGNQPYAATLNNGNFVVAWNEDDTYLGQFRIMDQNGNFVTSVTDFYSDEEARFTNITVLNSGKFVITFWAYDQDEIVFVVYNQDGTLDTGPTVVSEGGGTASEFQRGTIALSTGGWFTTYEDNNNIYGKLYNSASSVVTSLVIAATGTGDWYETTAVATDNDNIIVITTDDNDNNMYRYLYDETLTELQGKTLVCDNSGTSVYPMSMATFDSNVADVSPSAYCIFTGERGVTLNDNIFNCLRDISVTKWEVKFDDTHWDPRRGSWNGSGWDSGSFDQLAISTLGTWAENYRPLSVRFTFTGVPTMDDDIEINDDDSVEIGFAANSTSGQSIPLTFVADSADNFDLADTDDYDALFLDSDVSSYTVTNIEFEIPVGEETSTSSSSSSLSSSSLSNSSSSSSSSLGAFPEEIIFGENTIADVKNVTKDTYLDEEMPDTTLTGDSILEFKRTDEAVSNVLIKFDLSHLELVNIISIDGARLYFKTTSTVPDEVMVGVYGVNKLWESQHVTWRYATDPNRFWDLEGAHNWRTEAGLGDHRYNGDVKTPIAANTWYYWDVTGAVIDQYNRKEYNGFILRFPIEDGDDVFGSVDFHGSDAVDSDNKPYLYVNVTPASSSSSSRSLSSSESSSSSSSSRSSSSSSESSSSSTSSSSSSTSSSSSLTAPDLWIQRTQLTGETPIQNYVYSVGVGEGSDLMVAGTAGNVSDQAQIWGSTNGIGWELKWDSTLETRPQDAVLAFAYDSTNNVIVAGTAGEAEIWTASGGQMDTWVFQKSFYDDSGADTQNVQSLFYIEDGGVLLAGLGVQAEMWKSTDGGATWTLKKDFNAEFGDYTVQDMCWDSTRGRVIAFVSGSSQAKIYTSDDLGETWTFRHGFSTKRFAKSIVYDPLHDVVLAGHGFGGARVSKSTDGGVTWSTAVDWSTIDYPLSMYYHDGLQTIFIGTQDSGNAEIYISTDGGTTFDLEWTDFNTTYCYDLAYAPVSQKMLAGITFGGEVWTRNDYWPSSSSQSSSSTSSSSTSTGLTGTLAYIDNDCQGFSNYNKVWGDGTFIYAACSFDGVRSHSVDGGGNLTYIDVVAASVGGAGNGFSDVWSDGTFIYCTRALDGISSYSVDGGGNLTYIDTDDQGGNYRGVWGDGNYVYAVAYTTNAIHSYSVDGGGNLTHVDSGTTLLGYNSVWGDGTFIYVTVASNGIASYSVDGGGNLSYIDIDDQGGSYNKVWGDGNFIYVACGTDGIRSYSVDGGGNLSYIDVDDQGVEPYVDVWGDGNFIYVACEAHGIRSYAVDGSGNLTFKDEDYQGVNDYNGVWGDGTFIYVACDNNAGLRSYVVS